MMLLDGSSTADGLLMPGTDAWNLDEVDVAWMKGSDEPLSLALNLDVSKQLDGRRDGQVVGAADAAVVKQVVFSEPL